MSRYIDADKLQETYKELHDGKRSLLIDTEPTADVRENVRGEWIDITMWHDEYFGNKCQAPAQKCSNCGEWSVGINKKFCSNCGADMRGVKA